MPPTPCTRSQLENIFLQLVYIDPVGTDTSPEHSYRCPVPGCPFIGARLGHAGDCLKHVMHPKQHVAEHCRFLSDNFVCFRKPDGRSALQSTRTVPSALAFIDKEDQAVEIRVAYMRVCCICDKQPVQACSCCPKAFCEDHFVKEATNMADPLFEESGRCQLFIFEYCQWFPARVKASYLHHIVTNTQGYQTQELYTASGLWLSMYTKQPQLSAHAFCTQCYEQDFARFEQEGIQCTRWVEAGKIPGHVYWLQPGTTFSSKSSAVFSRLHCCDQAVYYELSGPALAILVLVATAKENMALRIPRRDAGQNVESLRVAYDKKSWVRIISCDADNRVLKYEGVWKITDISDQGDGCTITLLNMPASAPFEGFNLRPCSYGRTAWSAAIINI